MVTRESEESYMAAKVFMYTVHFFVFLIYSLYDNDLKLKMKSLNYLYVSSYFFFVLGMFYTWRRAGDNPGVIARQM